MSESVRTGWYITAAGYFAEVVGFTTELGGDFPKRAVGVVYVALGKDATIDSYKKEWNRAGEALGSESFDLVVQLESTPVGLYQDGGWIWPGKPAALLSDPDRNDYLVLAADTQEALEEKVNERLREQPGLSRFGFFTVGADLHRQDEPVSLKREDIEEILRDPVSDRVRELGLRPVSALENRSVTHGPDARPRSTAQTHGPDARLLYKEQV
jgi:hypothetical protein